jgi:alpha-glucosidase
MGRSLGLLMALMLAFAGCSDAEVAADAARHLLDNGVVVDVGTDGSVRLSKDGRTLITIDGRGPVSADFELLSNDLFGMWQFERSGEQRRGFSRYVGSDATADGAVVRYEAPDGSEARILLNADADAVRLHLSVDGTFQALALPLSCDAEASFFGWGAQYNATDQRGERFDLFVQEQGLGRKGTPEVLTAAGHAHTSYYPMPYFVDARGFGMLVETDYRTIVDLCASDASVAWLEVEAAEPLSALVFPGPTTADVVRALGDRVGRPKQPPAWAHELWIGSQGGRDAVLAEAAALEAAGIDVGVFWVQDWTGPRPQVGGGTGVQYRWTADDAHYPDLPGLVDDLHGRGYRFLAYANPFVMPSLSDHFDAMDAAGLLIQDGDGTTLLHPSPAGADASHPDLTNPESADYVKSFLTAMVRDIGFDGWMADFAEWLPIESTLFDGSDARAYHNRYPEAWHRLSREVMDQQRPTGDWVVFTRSGWTGQQAVAQVVWCGDQEATFEASDGLPTVVPCMLNLGLSGVPFVTHDIAGYSGGPSSKELFLRWVELGAFTPIMRTHEGNLKDENWSWDSDQQTIDHVRRFAAIHALLAPELQQLAREAADSSMPIVRHLMMVFPEDRAARAVDDQFMLGPDLLVAPVVRQGATSRSVYLPSGNWFHVWSGESYEGSATVEVAAPIGEPPVFSLGDDRSDLRQAG